MHFEEALRLEPDSAEAQYNLGNMLAESGRVQEAIEHYRQALRIKPNYAQARDNLAVLLATSNQTPQANENSQQARPPQLNKSDSNYNQGVLLADAGRWQEAVDQLVEALRLDPSRLQAYAKLATAYAQLQRPADAIAAAEKGLEMARFSGQTQLAQQFEIWLANYRTQQARPSGAPSSTDSVSPQPPR